MSFCFEEISTMWSINDEVAEKPTGNLPETPQPPHSGFTAFFAQIRGISSPKLILNRTGNIANLIFLLVTRRSIFPWVTCGVLSYYIIDGLYPVP